MLKLPTTPEAILRDVIPAAHALLPASMRSTRADVMLLAIGLQESRFRTRMQVGGPARSFWQFERRGGVVGVLTHQSSKARAADVCKVLDIPATSEAVYTAMRDDDILGCAFARLLLWTDPQPLPAVDDADPAWAYYLRTWRPGKPHASTWASLHERAVRAAAP